MAIGISFPTFNGEKTVRSQIRSSDAFTTDTRDTQRSERSVYLRIGPRSLSPFRKDGASANVSAKVTTAYAREIVAQFRSPARRRAAARRVPLVSHRAMAEPEIKACDFPKVE